MPYKDPEKARESGRKNAAKWRAANPDKARECVRRWREANPDKNKESNDRSKKKHSEQVAEGKRRYNAAHREERAEYIKNWRAKNAEHVAAYDVEYAEKNQEKIHRARSIRARTPSVIEYKRAQRFGITVRQLRALLAWNDGRCWLCDSDQHVVIDHCHEAGHVRGVLCSKCNRGLGHLGDNLVGLRAALTYLKAGYFDAC